LAKTFGIDEYFIYCLERAFGDRTQQLCVRLVDLDDVPGFWQQHSVDALSRSPINVFAFGAANRYTRVAVSSSGNFHFSLASKSKDAADAILNMIAGYLQSLISAFNRRGEVVVVPISDDQIFLQTTATLQMGGTPAMNMSRADLAGGLLATPWYARQLTAAHISAHNSDPSSCEMELRYN